MKSFFKVSRRRLEYYTLPYYICCSIWIRRNSILFNAKWIDLIADIINTVAYFNEGGPLKKSKKYRTPKIRDLLQYFSVGFFGGSSAGRKCGYGAIFYIFKYKWHHF